MTLFPFPRPVSQHITGTCCPHHQRRRQCKNRDSTPQPTASPFPAATLTTTTVPTLETHSRLHRESLKQAEEESKLLTEEPDALLSALETLISVRSAFESETPAQTSSSRSGIDRTATTSGAPPGTSSGVSGSGPFGKGRLKRRLDTEGPGTGAPSSAADSPALTPEPTSASQGSGRLAKPSARSGSVGLPGTSKSEPSPDVPGAAHDKYTHLRVGTQVFMRNRLKNADGEGILGNISHISGEGKARRYEIQDPEPDETGAQPPPYKAYLSSLEPIPAPSLGAALPDLHKGKQVIAVYPDTSTFYKAEVVGKRGEFVRLRFEGEEERDKEQEVERRLVLDVK